jgi:hypothetical protein
MTRTNYLNGFRCGERMAWRHKGKQATRPAHVRNEFHRGFWDGYCPRSPAWAAHVQTQLSGANQ